MYTAHALLMMTSSNGSIFHVTGHLCGEFIDHRWIPRTRSFDVFFDLRRNKRLSKQRWCWWFETPWYSLWCHCNVCLYGVVWWTDFGRFVGVTSLALGQLFASEEILGEYVTWPHKIWWHYSDVIMGAIASQIISLAILYSTVYSGANQREHKAPRHWPLRGELTGDWWIPRTIGQ